MVQKSPRKQSKIDHQCWRLNVIRLLSVTILFASLGATPLCAQISQQGENSIAGSALRFQCSDQDRTCQILLGKYENLAENIDSDTCSIEDDCLSSSVRIFGPDFNYSAFVRLNIFPRSSLGISTPFTCSGFLLPDRYLITNAHCFDGEIEKIDVVMNYIDPSDLDRNNGVVKVAANRIYSLAGFGAEDFHSSRTNLDFQLLRLEEDVNYTPAVLKYDNSGGFEEVFVIQYPHGVAQAVNSNSCNMTELLRHPQFLSQPMFLEHDCATRIGSSGAPILGTEHSVVALHRGNDRVGYPEATSMFAIIQRSAFIRSLYPNLPDQVRPYKKIYGNFHNLKFAGDVDGDGIPDVANYYSSTSASSPLVVISGSELLADFESLSFSEVEKITDIVPGESFSENCKSIQIFPTRFEVPKDSRLFQFELKCQRHDGNLEIHFFSLRNISNPKGTVGGKIEIERTDSRISSEILMPATKNYFLANFDRGKQAIWRPVYYSFTENEVITAPYFHSIGTGEDRFDFGQLSTLRSTEQFEEGYFAMKFPSRVSAGYHQISQNCRKSNFFNTAVGWRTSRGEYVVQLVSGAAMGRIEDHTVFGYRISGFEADIVSLHGLGTDLDGDQIDELLVVLLNGNVHILASTDICSSGAEVQLSGFEKSILITGLSPSYIVQTVGDLDGDGRSDLLFSGRNNPIDYFLLSTEKLAFVQHKELEKSDLFALGVAIEISAFGAAIDGGFDVDADGLNEILVSEGRYLAEIEGHGVSGRQGYIVYGSEVGRSLENSLSIELK